MSISEWQRVSRTLILMCCISTFVVGCTGGLRGNELASTSAPESPAPSDAGDGFISLDSSSPSALAESTMLAVSSAVPETTEYEVWLDAISSAVADDGEIGHLASPADYRTRITQFEAAVPITKAEWVAARQQGFELTAELLTPVAEARLLNNSDLRTFTADVAIATSAGGETVARVTIDVQLYCAMLGDDVAAENCVVYSMVSKPL